MLIGWMADWRSEDSTSFAFSSPTVINPLNMSNDMRLQCSCSAFFPTGDAFRAHLDEYRVSIQLIAGTELTFSRPSKDICPLSWKYTGPIRKSIATIQIATATIQMYTKMPRGQE